MEGNAVKGIISNLKILAETEVDGFFWTLKMSLRSKCPLLISQASSHLERDASHFGSWPSCECGVHSRLHLESFRGSWDPAA